MFEGNDLYTPEDAQAATAVADRHPAPEVQIKAPARKGRRAKRAESDEVCDPRHFGARWWPAPDAE